MIRRYGKHGLLTSARHCEQPPPYLRYQRYQFAHIAGRFRERSYRSGLRVGPARNVEECHGLIKRFAKQVYFPNGSVDVEDLVQIGETVLWEGLQDLRTRGVRPRPGGLKALLEAAQRAMFHAIDQRVVPLPFHQTPDGREASWDDGQELAARLLELGYSSRGLQQRQKGFEGLQAVLSRWDSEDARDCFQGAPGAECNQTVFRRGCHWEFRPNCCESWGAPLPPGSCQPRPTWLCSLPRHLPLLPRPGGGKPPANHGAAPRLHF